MQSSRIRIAVLVALAATMTLALVTTGCAKKSSKPDEQTSETPFTNPPKTTVTTAAQAVRQPCSTANLEAGAAGDYPGPKILDEACSSSAAVATLEAARVPGGTGVAFFAVGDDGAWKLLKVWNIDEAESAVPDGVPAALVTTWRASRDARLKAASTTTTVDKEHPPPTEEPPETDAPTDCAPDAAPEDCPAPAPADG